MLFQLPRSRDIDPEWRIVLLQGEERMAGFESASPTFHRGSQRHVYVTEHKRSVRLLTFYLNSERCLEGFLWDHESTDDIRGCLFDLDLHCVSACWIDQLAKGRSVYESQGTDGACRSEHSFEHSGYPAGGASLSGVPSGLIAKTMSRR